MQCSRRQFLRGVSAAGLILPATLFHGSALAAAELPQSWLDVRKHGAVGDGKTIDSNAINKAIEQAAARGGLFDRLVDGVAIDRLAVADRAVLAHVEPGLRQLRRRQGAPVKERRREYQPGRGNTSQELPPRTLHHHP